ncbi:MAG: hypothetical protein RIF37_01925 [Rhodospirillaceae bacterium]
MKFCALTMDRNDRSVMTSIEVGLTQISDTEWISEKQDATAWSIATRQPGEPFAGGPTEMHLTNFPSLVCCMQGHLEVTGQDGESCRLSTGEGIFLDGRALHHSTFGPSHVPVTYLTMTFPGTQDHAFK